MSLPTGVPTERRSFAEDFVLGKVREEARRKEN